MSSRLCLAVLGVALSALFADAFASNLDRARSAIIVGAGVNGLTTGITLLQRGWNVTIVAKETTPATTSDRAAAFWLPFLSAATPEFEIWSEVGYQQWLSIQGVAGASVYARVLHYLVPKGKVIPEPWWARFVNNFQKWEQDPLAADYWSYTFDTSLMEARRTMPWLMNEFTRLNGIVRAETVERLELLLDPAILIINCAGLASRCLADDLTVGPIRGQMVAVETPPDFPRDAILIDEETPGELAYIVPVSDAVYLGGTDQVNNWSTASNPEDVQLILNRTTAINPDLAGQPVIESWAGLRPSRTDGVRLGFDEVHPGLLHNYGHGGSGWTVSWGCAAAVANLAETWILREINSTAR